MLQFLHEFSHIILIRVKSTRNWLYYLLRCFYLCTPKQLLYNKKQSYHENGVLALYTMFSSDQFYNSWKFKMFRTFIRLNKYCNLRRAVRTILLFIYKIKTIFLVILGRNITVQNNFTCRYNLAKNT